MRLQRIETPPPPAHKTLCVTFAETQALRKVIVNTSLLRTYRNLRLGIAGTVVLIGIAVGVTATQIGVLPSISAYYYTAARDIFVGALIAAALGIITLSGHGIQRALLDAAGLFAPLIALVPTPIRNGTVPAFLGACPGVTKCIPEAVLPDIDVGVITYLVAGALAIVVAILVSTFAAEGSLRRSTPSLVIACVVLLLVLITWVWAREFFLAQTHLVAGVIFFGLIAAVAIANVFDQGQGARPVRWRRIVYWLIAVSLFVDVAILIIVITSGVDVGTLPPPVFVGEFIALTLFVIFWVVQSLERWEQPNPALA